MRVNRQIYGCKYIFTYARVCAFNARMTVKCKFAAKRKRQRQEWPSAHGASELAAAAAHKY